MDYSSMSLLSCPRKYEYTVLRKKGGDPDSPALNFGTLWHKIRELHGKGEVEVVDRAAAMLNWVDPIDDWRTLDKARLAYQRYQEFYKPWEIHMTEEGFSVNLPGIEEPYTGRIDSIVTTDSGEGKGKEKWVVDFKTSSSLPSEWVALYRVSDQFKLYYTVARMFDPNVVGVCVDLLHVTKGNKSGKTEGEREGVRMYRVFFRYTEEHCAEAVADFAVISQTVKFYEQLGYFPKNTKMCREFNRPCVFLDVCDQGNPDLREKILAALPENTFDPLRID